ncbi:MAG: hypothetical protein JWM21_1174 [Acidobacteria bacterium]|nr:hypothetical protein [Acidobacteriota bacterium]
MISVSPTKPRLTTLITLLTDFGLADYFVGAMKGVMLRENPRAQFVDITHDIPPHNIEAGAFTLLAAYQAFPAKTIHLAVVDPGVGSARRPLVIAAGKQFFVGPDNGLFSYILEREAKARIFHVTNEKYFRRPVSRTFHGRDIFAPVAGALSLGVKPAELGTVITDPCRLALLSPERSGKGNLRARIIHIDRFGNCLTNLTQRELTPAMIEGGVRLKLKGTTITAFRQFFSDEGDHRSKLFAIWGSAGFLEIAAQNHSAAQLMKVAVGQEVSVSAKK